MHSFQITVDNEPVVICFKNVKAGIKIAKMLKEKFPTTHDQDCDDLMKYARCAASFAIQQPTFVDVYSHQLDHRIQIPSQLARTVTGTQEIQDNRAKQQTQQVPVIHQTQQRIPSAAAISDNVYKIVYQILIHMFTKEPALLMQASYQTGIRLDKGDPAQLQQLVKGMAVRLMRFPLQEMILKLQEIQSIPPELLSKLNELMKMQDANQPQMRPPMLPSLPTPPIIQRPNMNIAPMAPPQATQAPALTLSLNNYKIVLKELGEARINQASQVMDQLEPSKISQLLHGASQKFQKKYSFVKQEYNVVSLTEEGRKVVKMDGIMQSIRASWSSEIVKKNVQAVTDLSQKILKLFGRSQDQHQKLFLNHDIIRFHQGWTDQENLFLLMLTRQEISGKESQIFDWKPVFKLTEKIVQISVFEELQKLVEKHRQQGIEASRARQEQRNVHRAPEQKMPQQPQQQLPPVPKESEQSEISEVKPNQNEPEIQVKQEIKQETKIDEKPKVIEAEPSVVRDVKKEQEIKRESKMSQLSPEFQKQIRDIFTRLVNQVEPITIIKVIVLILGIGTKYELDDLKTRTFFEAELQNIVKDSRFEMPQERLFIIVSEMIPIVLGVLRKRDTQGPKQMLYMGRNFEQFYEEYMREVKRVNEIEEKREEEAAKSPFLLIFQNEISQMLGDVAEKQVPHIIHKLGISTHVMIKRSAFGVDRSETDSNDM